MPSQGSGIVGYISFKQALDLTKKDKWIREEETK